MALRKPLVLVTGEIAQLPAGDDVDAPFSGTIDITLFNDQVAAAVIGAPVYASSAGKFSLALATAAGTAKVIGLVNTTSIAGSGSTGSGPIATSGVMTATTGQWDAITGASGGLVFNTNYYLKNGATGGLMVATTPTTTVGENNVFIGRGLSATVMELGIRQPILL